MFVSSRGLPSHERLRWAIAQRHARLALLTAADLPHLSPRDALALSLLLLEDELRRVEPPAGETRRRPLVLVAGDEPLLVRGAALLLDRARDMDAIYVGSAVRARRLLPSGAQAIAWAGDHLDEATLDCLREVRQAFPATGLCMLARRTHAGALQRLVDEGTERLAFASRPERYDARDFVELIRAVLRGRSSIDPSLIRHATSGTIAEDRLQLTDAEREVMEMVAAGLRNREIARRLWKSEKAVEKQVGRLFQKLGLPADSTTHLDRRVAATRIYLARRPERPTEVGGREGFEVPSAAPEPGGG